MTIQIMKLSITFFAIVISLHHNLYAAGDLTRQNPLDVEIEMKSINGSHFFSPSLIRLETGNLYRIILRNYSDEKHYFSSPNFSKAVFTRKVQVLKDGERIAEIKGKISDVEVFPNSVVEWWVVPIQTGEFKDLKCYVKDEKTKQRHSDMGMVGTIIID